jgi:hypothetical protein
VTSARRITCSSLSALLDKLTDKKLQDENSGEKQTANEKRGGAGGGVAVAGEQGHWFGTRTPHDHPTYL